MKRIARLALPLVLLAAIAALTIGASCNIPSMSTPSICFQISGD